MLRHGSGAPNNALDKHGHEDGVRRSKTEARCKIMESHDTHGWIISALLREMAGSVGQAMFQCVESNFSFNTMSTGGLLLPSHARWLG